MHHFIIVALVVAALGCKQTPKPPATPPDTTQGGEIANATADPKLSAAVAGSQRSAENRARDRYRHPVETLTVFGITPDMDVLEIRPGGGWYTEILGPYLRDSGKLIVGVPSAEGPRAKYRKRFLDMQAERPEVFGDIDVVTFDPPAPIDLGPDASVDMVLSFRNTHNWIGDDGEKQAYSAFFDVLRPGGILGVVQHRADDGTDPKETAQDGYVSQSYVIAVAEEAGFELVGRSDINRNAKDTHDHPEGVWTLPPVLRLEDQDRQQYIEIGESDRMTLKFRKPLAAQ